MTNLQHLISSFWSLGERYIACHPLECLRYKLLPTESSPLKWQRCQKVPRINSRERLTAWVPVFSMMGSESKMLSTTDFDAVQYTAHFLVVFLCLLSTCSHHVLKNIFLGPSLRFKEKLCTCNSVSMSLDILCMSLKCI